MPSREAKFAAIKAPIAKSLAAHLTKLGSPDLYAHQAHAYDAASAGSNVLVVTGTNSGKSLCYTLPALNAILKEPMARALFVFPTKALARDQAERLEKLKPDSDIKIGVYDGDTPKPQRSAVRKSCHIVITNPDMLHVGILPQHEHWAPFLRSLRVAALDEIHVYRGVFGSHFSGVMRRFLTLCEWHRALPTLIGSSASIANPLDHFRALTGQDAVLVDEDGSPQMGKTVLFCSPPRIGEGIRGSANVATASLMANLITSGAKTLAFSRSRPAAEQVLLETRKQIEGLGLDQGVVDSYRGGYTPRERREIEKKMFGGDLRGLSSTNALELGVDIGGLDAVILNGFPGSISSFWQQAGRSGRGQSEGLAAFVGHNDAMEQYLISHPQVVLDQGIEPSVLDQSNPSILASQLECAAYERGLSLTDLDRFGPTAIKVAESLEETGNVGFGSGRFFYKGFDSPALRTSLRGSTNQSMSLVASGQTIGEMEKWRATQYAHPGAIYLHRGSMFRVESFDEAALQIQLEPCLSEYLTFPIVQTSIRSSFLITPSTTTDSAELLSVVVRQSVTGYLKRSTDHGRSMGQEQLEMPDQVFETLAIRLSFETPQDDLTSEFAAGVHSVEHALMAIAPLMAGCDRLDLGSAWDVKSSDSGRACVWVYDQAVGGVGLCQRLYEVRKEWISRSLTLLTDCPCFTGCPSCLFDARCIHGNALLDKPRAIQFFKELLSGS